MKTPKANPRQERINSTRPGLKVNFDGKSLNTITEITESACSDYFNVQQNNEWLGSSEKQSGKKTNFNSESNEDNGSSTNKNKPTQDEFNVEIGR